MSDPELVPGPQRRDTIGPPRESTLKSSWEDHALPGAGREDPEEYPSFVVAMCLFIAVLLSKDDGPKKDDDE